MNILNDLTAISYDELNDWLQKRQKSDKHALKRLYNKLLTQLIVFDHKLNNLKKTLDRDPENVKIQLRLNQLKTIITEYEQYIGLVNKKIFSFQTNAWNRLSSIQHEELMVFENELNNISDEELNKTVFTEIKRAQVHYLGEIQTLDQNDATQLTDEEFTSWTEKKNQAKNAYIFTTFKLDCFEKEWFHRRIHKIATLPTQIQDKTDDFLYDLRNHRDEKLMFLKAKYKKQLALNHNNPSLHHKNTQLDIFITDIQLELRARHIKKPKLFSKKSRYSLVSVVPNPQSAAHPIIENNENDVPIIQYKTTKVKVLFNHSTTSVSEAPQRPATPSNFY